MPPPYDRNRPGVQRGGYGPFQHQQGGRFGGVDPLTGRIGGGSTRSVGSSRGGPGSFADIIGRGVGTMRTLQDQQRAGISPMPNSNPYGLDEETLREIAMIEEENDIAMAEHAAAVANAQARADYQRRLIQRQMGIADTAGNLAGEWANRDYGTLMQSLQTLIPGMEQGYAAGEQAIGNAYSTGASVVEQAAASNPELAQQLAQVSGATTQQAEAEAAQYSSPATAMAGMLQGAGPNAVAAMHTLAMGDVAAARNAIPGYIGERDELLGDIDLERDAALSELRNDLAGIVADLPSDDSRRRGLGMQRAIDDAIRRGMERRQQEEEANQPEIPQNGLQAAAFLARESGNPDLISTFQELLGASRGGGMVGPDEMSEQQMLQRGINAYDIPYESRAVGTRRGHEPALADRLLRNQGVLGSQGVDLSNSFLRGPVNAIGGLFGQGGDETEYTVMSRETPAERRIRTQRVLENRALLQNMLEAYYGNYYSE